MNKPKQFLHDLVLIRSDQGDGGWSLHWSGDEDEDGVPSIILESGDAAKNIDDEWDRPDQRDHDNAMQKLVGAGVI